MINSIVEEFKVNLMEDGKSPKTIERYVGDVSAFLAYLEAKGVAFNGEIKRFYLTSYRNHLIENQHEITTLFNPSANAYVKKIYKR